MHLGQAARFQEALRRLAIFDEGFAEAESGPSLGRIVSAAPEVATAVDYDVESVCRNPTIIDHSRSPPIWSGPR
jgi:hypothetical protein